MIDSLYDLIKENLLYAGLPNFGLVFANQNMPRVSKPYVVMNVLNIEIPDHVIYHHDINPDGYRTLSGWRKATVELQFYNGIESLSSASRMALSLESENSLQSQGKLNCSIGQRLFFSYVPEILNQSQFEGRAIYHFEYFYTEEFADQVGLIEKVIIDGAYTGILTDQHCHEEIEYHPQFDETEWDDYTTEWDSNATIWDEVDEQSN